MASLRIIYDNVVADATLTASTEAGSLVVENLLTDRKSAGWRSTATAASLTLVWSEAKTVAGAILPYTNLTQAATIRVRGYTLATDPSPDYDSGTVLACPATPVRLRGWAGTQLGANSYAYGGGACARLWFPAGSFEKIVINLADTGNPDGYIEASRLIVGDYWAPRYGAEQGASMTPHDYSKHERTESGDLVTDVGTRCRKMQLNAPALAEADRISLMDILAGNGMPNPVYVSLFPGDASPERERDHQLYGKLSQISAVTLSMFTYCSAPLEFESI